MNVRLERTLVTLMLYVLILTVAIHVIVLLDMMVLDI